MPIYEYCCQDCQHEFEEWQQDFEERELVCPSCGGVSRRMISHSSFILKGSGWYVTDYNGRKPHGNDNDNGNGDKKADKPESKTDSKVDFKPAPKSEPVDTGPVKTDSGGTSAGANTNSAA